ncbi:MAG: RidA family protein [Bacillota bacterium]
MIRRISLGVGEDATYCSCAVAGDFIFTSHQGGGQHSDQIEVQLEAAFKNLEEALQAAGASLDDIVQINLLLKELADFHRAEAVFRKVFTKGYPPRSTYKTEFIAPQILVQIDAIAYRPSPTAQVSR